MVKWREKWWEKYTLVDKLVLPLIARLEQEGWEGLAEDMATRERIAMRFAKPGYTVYPRCKECKGRGVVTLYHGPEDIEEYECFTCRGMGVDYWEELMAEDRDEYARLFQPRVPIAREGQDIEPLPF